MEPKNRIFCAFDTSDLAQAKNLATTLKPHIGGIKLGLQFFTACGPDGIKQIVETGMPVFLDLKFHDIPNTVAKAVYNASQWGPMMMNLHAAGGTEMMRAAHEAAQEGAAKAGVTPPKLIGVTVLTSLNNDDMGDLGSNESIGDRVRRLAEMTMLSGLDGVVASAQEIKIIRKQCGANFLLVTPGIRPTWAGNDDQKRILTPAQAIADGSDYLVIGRPITNAKDPVEAAKKIVAEISSHQTNVA